MIKQCIKISSTGLTFSLNIPHIYFNVKLIYNIIIFRYRPKATQSTPIYWLLPSSWLFQVFYLIFYAW